MNWKSFFSGVAIGLAIGIFAAKTTEKLGTLNSEDVLAKVKNELKKKGKITGSWIIAQPETYQKNDLTYQVYRGGITCLQDHQSTTYEFLADAKTGTVLELNKLNQ